MRLGLSNLALDFLCEHTGLWVRLSASQLSSAGQQQFRMRIVPVQCPSPTVRPLQEVSPTTSPISTLSEAVSEVVPVAAGKGAPVDQVSIQILNAHNLLPVAVCVHYRATQPFTKRQQCQRTRVLPHHSLLFTARPLQDVSAVTSSVPSSKPVPVPAEKDPPNDEVCFCNTHHLQHTPSPQPLAMAATVTISFWRILLCFLLPKQRSGSVSHSDGRHPALFDQKLYKIPPEHMNCSIRSGPTAQHSYPMQPQPLAFTRPVNAGHHPNAAHPASARLA